MKKQAWRAGAGHTPTSWFNGRWRHPALCLRVRLSLSGQRKARTRPGGTRQAVTQTTGELAPAQAIYLHVPLFGGEGDHVFIPGASLRAAPLEHLADMCDVGTSSRRGEEKPRCACCCCCCCCYCHCYLMVAGWFTLALSRYSTYPARAQKNRHKKIDSVNRHNKEPKSTCTYHTSTVHGSRG